MKYVITLLLIVHAFVIGISDLHWIQSILCFGIQGIGWGVLFSMCGYQFKWPEIPEGYEDETSFRYGQPSNKNIYER